MDKNTEPEGKRTPEREQHRTDARSHTKIWAAVGGAIIVIAGGGWIYSHGATAPTASAHPALPMVTVSTPLVHDLDTRLGFLGQFSAVDRVDLRAQVGGTLTGISFKDGDVVQKGALLFTVDPVPYEIRLSQAMALLETAKSKWNLANREFTRANELQRNDAGTVQNVDQRTADLQAAKASVDDANAQIRDAQFDLDHCRIYAPFTGRIGSHLVSIGNLIAGSRAATSPTTLLATLVSLDPIYLDFDMSESDYQDFSKFRSTQAKGSQDVVELGLSDESDYPRKGVLDFINNVLDRSSGTIHARATVANPGLLLTPGEFSRVRVVVARVVPTLLVPDAAVLPDQSQHSVMTVSADGTVKAKEVSIGPLRGGLRVIRSGLDQTDRVVIDGMAFAAPGAKVTAQVGAIRYAENQD